MGSNGKTAAVVEWLNTYPELDGYLKLNATELEAGERTVSTVYNDAKVREFIDGTVERQYTFAVVMVCDWSSGFDAVNAEAESWGERWLDWCDAQFKAGNVPNFGDKCTIRAIESLQNIPSLAATYQEEQLARYMFQARITYWEKE